MPRALITGCSTGIGRATAVELTRRGYEVVATARRPETLEGLDAAERLALDVDDDRSVQAAVDAAGEVDVLVNNAGRGIAAPVETAPLDAVRSIFETNVFGVLRMVQAVVPGMRERGRGTIVNVSSVAGRSSSALNGLYAATKFAVEAISEAMHYELGHFGLRVAVVEPGYVDTAWPQNEKWLEVDGPYRPLYEQVAGRDERQREAGGSSPELVAGVIAEAVETAEPRLRWPAGEGAELSLGVRAQVDDEEWEALVREFTGLDW